MTRPINSSEPYNSAVSISVMPRSMPVRKAASSSAGGCLPWASRAEPCPSAGTLRPSRSFTVRALVAGLAAWPKADESAVMTHALAVTQNRLNSRRFRTVIRCMRSVPPLAREVWKLWPGSQDRV